MPVFMLLVVLAGFLRMAVIAFMPELFLLVALLIILFVTLVIIVGVRSSR